MGDAAVVDREHSWTFEQVFGLLLVLLFMGFVLVAFPWVIYDSFRQKQANVAVDAALADPAFVARAEAGGFRIEKGMDRGGLAGKGYVLARCARSNEAGPLPCGPFPDDTAHPGILVKVMR